EGKACYGQSLQGFAEHIVAHDRRLHLNWLINYFNYFKDKNVFFTSYFDKLAGSNELREQIEAGKSEHEIRNSWQGKINAFKEVRKKYLLYEDFE
ncbi:MAG: DUF1343 domain-containing protein, partial [Bacteroidales bacterium]|nr:DUF1343 domain-containing protein [Bacteroidales bacterium]